MSNVDRGEGPQAGDLGAEERESPAGEYPGAAPLVAALEQVIATRLSVADRLERAPDDLTAPEVLRAEDATLRREQERLLDRLATLVPPGPHA